MKILTVLNNFRKYNANFRISKCNRYIKYLKYLIQTNNAATAREIDFRRPFNNVGQMTLISKNCK